MRNRNNLNHNIGSTNRARIHSVNRLAQHVRNLNRQKYLIKRDATKMAVLAKKRAANRKEALAKAEKDHAHKLSTLAKDQKDAKEKAKLERAKQRVKALE